MEKKRVWKLFAGIMIFAVFFMGASVHMKASDKAEFRVQTAEEKEDGIIRVSVYLTEVSELGGVEAEFLYDASKVTYVGSGLGKSFTGGIGETTHISDSGAVRCVAVFPEAKTAHGELMYVFFRLNDAESYQPELKVIDLVDASDEIQPIPYSITYQQADGSWKDAQDTSEVKASEDVITEAREMYGASEDKEGSGEITVGEKSAEELQEDSSGKTAGETSDGAAQDSKGSGNDEEVPHGEIEKAEKTKDQEDENGKGSVSDKAKWKIFGVCGIAALILGVIFLGRSIQKRRN